MELKLALVVMTFLALVAPSAQYTRHAEDSCDIIGDADLYGIGVRVSYYLATFSGIIALAFANGKAVEDVKKANATLGFALFIILVRNATQGSLAVFEWDLVFTMVFILMSVAFLPLMLIGGIMSSGVLIIVYGLYAILLPWIYFTLADQGRKEGCELKAFVFAYFDFYNPHWIGFLKVTSIFSAIGGAAYIIGGLGLVVYAFIHPEKRGLVDDDDADILARVFAFVALAVSCVIIAFTEKLISGNNVDLSEAILDNTSQLIPFLIGLFSFVSTIWTCIKDVVSRKKED